jgi:hypothetical protein
MHQRPSDENNIERRAFFTSSSGLHLKRDSYSNYLAFCIFQTTKAADRYAHWVERCLRERIYFCA